MRKRFKIVILVVVLILLFVLLSKIDFKDFYTNLKSANLIFVLVSFAFLWFSFLVWNYRFSLILPRKTDFFSLYPILMAGNFMATITPGARVGGEPIRAYYLAKKYKGSKTEYLSYVFLEKAFNIKVFAILSLISVVFIVLFLNVSTKAKVALEIFVLFFTLLISLSYLLRRRIKLFHISKLLQIIYNFPLSEFIRKRFITYEEFEEVSTKKINRFKELFKKGLKNKKTFWTQITLVSITWLLRFLSSYFIFLALGYKLNLFPILVVITITYLIGDFSIVPGGIGIMEVVMISLYSAIGVPLSIGAIVSLLSRVFEYFNTLIIGGISFVYLSWRYR